VSPFLLFVGTWQTRKFILRDSAVFFALFQSKAKYEKMFILRFWSENL